MDELADKEHLKILDNSDANLFVKVITFKDYCDIGFEADKALQMVGLRQNDLENNLLLKTYYLQAIKKN